MTNIQRHEERSHYDFVRENKIIYLYYILGDFIESDDFKSTLYLIAIYMI